jgi:hypothetical protein
MKTQNTERIANEIEAVASHFFIKGLKIWGAFFGIVTIQIIIQVVTAMNGHFEIGMCINAIMNVGILLKLRKYKKSKGENK